MSIFDHVDEIPVTSVATKRRINLLEPVIPELGSLATRNFSIARKYSKERRFWTEFMTPFLRIEKGGDKRCLRMLRDEHDDLLIKVLGFLDSMIEIKDYAVAEEYLSAVFPRLETMRQIVLTCDENGDQDLLIESICLIMPVVEEKRRDVIQQLSQLADLLQNEAETLPIEEDIMPTTHKRLVSPLLLNMLSTLSRCWGCSFGRPSHQHRAALPLLTHKNLPPGADSIAFTLLLSRWNSPQRWQETCVSVSEQSKPTKVRIVLPENAQRSRPSKTHPGRTKVVNLCDVIDKAGSSRLNLDVEGRLLFSTSATTTEVHGLEKGNLISLTKGIFFNDAGLGIQAKICMALVLSYSLIDFCGEPWFPQGWSRDSIYIMQSNGILSLRPYLLTNVKPANRSTMSHQSTPREATAADIRLLHHGLLLMELFFQEPLELDASSSLETLRQKAHALFNDRPADKWDIHERYRQAVETCIVNGPRLFPHELQSESVDNFTKVVCDMIVAPLEIEFEAFCGLQDPDDMISRLKFPGVKLIGSAEDSKSQPNLQSLVPARTITTRAGNFVKHGVSMKKTPYMPMKFFDVAETVDQQEIERARHWFARFEQIDRHQVPRPQTKGRRIRVAVLDTGIDLNNPWAAGNPKRFKCWPKDYECRDEEGHGTHVAYLILKFAPNIELHVHKVSRFGLFKDADIGRIAKAIKSSSTGPNKVDIINLSFGFPQYEEKLRPILEAIRTARSNNVLIFAAAGNEGGNEGVYWPAALDTDVLQISASDSHGRPSSFSSDTGIRSRISTLGEGVPSCQTNAKKEIIHRSGTSFATPIATAIAALVLGFVDSFQASDLAQDIVKALPEGFLGLLPRIRTRTGMERVLRETCVLQSAERRTDVAYITPWHFLEMEALTRIHMILNVLRTVPE